MAACKLPNAKDICSVLCDWVYNTDGVGKNKFGWDRALKEDPNAQTARLDAFFDRGGIPVMNR